MEFEKGAIAKAKLRIFLRPLKSTVACLELVWGFDFTMLSKSFGGCFHARVSYRNPGLMTFGNEPGLKWTKKTAPPVRPSAR
jgi:hypothetical protein